jgi:hypothetical protein
MYLLTALHGTRCAWRSAGTRRIFRIAFPRAKGLHEAARTVGSTSEELIRSAGFDVIQAPSKALPNHYRIIHPDGVAGFNDGNLARLAQVFVNTTGH